MKEFKGLDKHNNEIWLNENSERVCISNDCDKIAVKRGYCQKHYRQIQRHGRLTPELEIATNVPETCTVEGCNEKYYALGYCTRHHSQFKIHGKILERTKFDKNEVVDCGDYYEMILYDKSGNEVKRSLIDKITYEKIKNIKWSYGATTGYVYGNTNGKNVALHRFIMDVVESDILIDHINRNKLDNRMSNLRLADNFQNAWNVIYKDEGSVQGVSFRKDRKVWCARLTYKGEVVLRKSFKSYEEAVMARLKAEKEYFGEFAPQKHLYEIYEICCDVTVEGLISASQYIEVSEVASDIIDSEIKLYRVS